MQLYAKLLTTNYIRNHAKLNDGTAHVKGVGGGIEKMFNILLYIAVLYSLAF
jgi:hypothetical protein